MSGRIRLLWAGRAGPPVCAWSCGAMGSATPTHDFEDDCGDQGEEPDAQEHLGRGVGH
jgi:hypothetical protein